MTGTRRNPEGHTNQMAQGVQGQEDPAQVVPIGRQLAPGKAVVGPFDFANKAHAICYKEATKPLVPERYDCSPKEFFRFVENLLEHATSRQSAILPLGKVSMVKAASSRKGTTSIRRTRKSFSKKPSPNLAKNLKEDMKVNDSCGSRIYMNG